jgi:hypothetical protein
MDTKEKEDRVVPDDPVAVKELAQALAAPFEPSEVKWKAQVVSGSRALAVAFVDARVIQDRLDEVMGVMGWQDSYECLPDGAVVCRLRIRLGAEWITKMDVGGQSEQPDEGDRRKAAFSDALKRAAVKFGIGRYLYRLEPQWVDYDPQKKRITGTPRLPADALPHPATVRAPAPPPSPPDGGGKGKRGAKAAPPAEPAAPPAEAKGEKKPAKGVPANGVELQRRLYDYDERLAKQGMCRAGELVQHVVKAGVKAGFDRDLANWAGPAILLAVEETRLFEAKLRQPAGADKEVKKEVA